MDTRTLAIEIPKPLTDGTCHALCPVIHRCALIKYKDIGPSPGPGCPWFKSEVAEVFKSCFVCASDYNDTTLNYCVGCRGYSKFTPMSPKKTESAEVTIERRCDNCANPELDDCLGCKAFSNFTPIIPKV